MPQPQVTGRRRNVGGVGSLGCRGGIVAGWGRALRDVGEGSLRGGAPVAPPAHAGAHRWGQESHSRLITWGGP